MPKVAVSLRKIYMMSMDGEINNSYEALEQRYTYDDSDRLTSIVGDNKDGNVFVKKFFYDGEYLSRVSFDDSYRQGEAKYSYTLNHTRAIVEVSTNEQGNITKEKYEYELDRYGNIVREREYDSKWTYKNVLMPLSEYLVYKNVKGFSDISNRAYYRVPVKWAVYRGITNGIAEDVFAPNQSCTRGQIVTFLWRAAGKPKAQNTVNKFTDIKIDSYYYDAVQWAVEQGITTGTTDTTFSPDKSCTRAQAVTFLWRTAGKPNVENDINSFWDTAYDSYYYNAVRWAVEQGITNGTSDTTFSPSNTCTRGQIVTFLYRDMA